MLKILISVRNDLKGRAYMRELELELKERRIPYRGQKTDKRVRIIAEA